MSFVQVGNGLLGWRGLGIHSSVHSAAKWIPGSTLARRPGMTREMMRKTLKVRRRASAVSNHEALAWQQGGVPIRMLN